MKKRTSKSKDLVDALIQAYIKGPSKKELKVRNNLNKALEAGTAGYDPKYDAYYYIDTNKWIEPKCGDKLCHYCKKRPKKHQ